MMQVWNEITSNKNLALIWIKFNAQAFLLLDSIFSLLEYQSLWILNNVIDEIGSQIF